MTPGKIYEISTLFWKYLAVNKLITDKIQNILYSMTALILSGTNFVNSKQYYLSK